MSAVSPWSFDHPFPLRPSLNFDPQPHPTLISSDCWKKCNHDVTESIPAPWTHETNLNQWSFISKNCLYPVYLETMAKCLVVTCESTWDVQYAVEYGEGMCRKAVSLFLLSTSIAYVRGEADISARSSTGP